MGLRSRVAAGEFKCYSILGYVHVYIGNHQGLNAAFIKGGYV